MKKLLSLQIVVSFLFVFATKSYSSDYDYGIFSACINGCKGNTAEYSKLSETEKEDADRLIKNCVQACMSAVKENENNPEKTESVTEPVQKETEQLEEEQQNTYIERKIRPVLDLGIGMAYPMQKVYTGTIDAEFGGLGASGYIGFGLENEKAYGGIEFFGSSLSSFTNYAGSSSFETYTKSIAYYIAGKIIFENKYNSYFKLGLGRGKTTTYYDFHGYNISGNYSVKGFSYYVAIGGIFYESNEPGNNIGCEVRLSSSKYKDDAPDYNIKSYNYVLLSTMFFVRF